MVNSSVVKDLEERFSDFCDFSVFFSKRVSFHEPMRMEGTLIRLLIIGLKPRWSSIVFRSIMNVSRVGLAISLTIIEVSVRGYRFCGVSTARGLIGGLVDGRVVIR